MLRSEGPDILCKLERKLPPFKDLGYRLWSDEPGNLSWIELGTMQNECKNKIMINKIIPKNKIESVSLIPSGVATVDGGV